MLRAVIFDLDGVVTDSAAYHYQAWKQIADKLEIPFDESYNEKLKGISRLGSLNLILDNGLGRDHYSDEEKEGLMQEKNKNYRELIRQITPKDLLPGIGELLKELKESGVLVGLASVSKNAGIIIGQLEVEAYFDYIADAAKVEKSKPYPDIFLDCVRNLGVRAEECVGIEDAKAGIEAIHRAGMKAVGVGSFDQMQGADLILNGTGELSLGLLQKLIGE